MELIPEGHFMVEDSDPSDIQEGEETKEEALNSKETETQTPPPPPPGFPSPPPPPPPGFGTHIDPQKDYNETSIDADTARAMLLGVSGNDEGVSPSTENPVDANDPGTWINSNISSWDGRDHLGQIVSPGTYIIHIETYDFSNGKTSKDTAPIVVGVSQ